MISAPVISNKYQVFLQHCIIDSPSSNRATHPYTHMACLTAQVSNPLIGQCRTHFAVPESCLVSPVCRPPSLSVFFFFDFISPPTSLSLLSSLLSLHLIAFYLSQSHPLHLTLILPPSLSLLFLQSSSFPPLHQLRLHGSKPQSHVIRQLLGSWARFAATHFNAGFLRFSLLSTS